MLGAVVILVVVLVAMVAPGLIIGWFVGQINKLGEMPELPPTPPRLTIVKTEMENP